MSGNFKKKITIVMSLWIHNDYKLDFFFPGWDETLKEHFQRALRFSVVHIYLPGSVPNSTEQSRCSTCNCVRERREFDSLNFDLDLCPPDTRPNAHLSVLTVAVEPPLQIFTFYPGERLNLSCPASDSTQAVNWTKDHVLVVDGEHTHIRNGHLEIESMDLSDSGLYACTTFGNHSSFFNISGILGKRRGGGVW